MLGRGWGNPTDWFGTDPRNNGKYHPDQAEDASCSGSTKELCRSEMQANGVRGWGQSYAQGLALERGRTKCYADKPLVMPLKGIHVDDKLQFMEEPVEIMEREIKRLKRAGYHWLRFAGTLGEVLSSPGNVKIRSNKNTHSFSQTGLRHPLQGEAYCSYSLTIYMHSNLIHDKRGRRAWLQGKFFHLYLLQGKLVLFGYVINQLGEDVGNYNLSCYDNNILKMVDYLLRFRGCYNVPDHVATIGAIEVIETAQRQLDVGYLIASGKRAGLADRIRRLGRENLRVRALLCIEIDRVDSLRRHMTLSQEEFRQFRRDRDDARRRLRRLELFVERRLGFRP
ncbi:hypothetical protein Tco_1533587 [Tanacetum coccineum]